MIFQFHTPKGVVDIDSEQVTNYKLSKIGFTREKFNTFLTEQPRDLAAEITAQKAEIDELKARLDKITKVNGVS